MDNIESMLSIKRSDYVNKNVWIEYTVYEILSKVSFKKFGFFEEPAVITLPLLGNAGVFFFFFTIF